VIQALKSETKTIAIISLTGLFIISGALFLESSMISSTLGSGPITTLVNLEASPLLGGGVTASPSSTANASFLFLLINGGDDTYISSLSMWQGTAMVNENANDTGVITSNSTSSSSSTEGIVITSWQSNRNSSDQIDFSVHSSANDVPSETGPVVTTFHYYPRTALPINIKVGETWNFAIIFANGHSASGQVIAQ